jgi:hypothetical protein
MLGFLTQIYSVQKRPDRKKNAIWALFAWGIQDEDKKVLKP